MSRLRLAVVFLVFGVVIALVVGRWDDVRAALQRMSLGQLGLAGVLVLGGLGASALTWRAALRELGSTVSVPAASKIHLTGQLAKYLPGSVWMLPAQMELGHAAGVPRIRALVASILAIGINSVTGLAIGLFVVAVVLPGGVWRVVTIFGLFAVGALALSPPVLSRVLDLGLRVLRSPKLERDVSWQGIVAAASWSIAGWMCYGMSLWVLAVAAGAPAGRSLPLCVAGSALAITLGFLVVLAPSGIGVREAGIVAALAPVLDGPTALAVAVAARLLFTVADLVAAAVVIPIRLRPVTTA